MALHIHLTMIILFINIMLTLMFPSYGLLLENNVFVASDYGEYDINNDYIESVNLDNNNLSSNTFGLIDAFLLVWDFILLIINFVIYLPVLAFKLPVDST